MLTPEELRLQQAHSRLEERADEDSGDAHGRVHGEARRQHQALSSCFTGTKSTNTDAQGGASASRRRRQRRVSARCSSIYLLYSYISTSTDVQSIGKEMDLNAAKEYVFAMPINEKITAQSSLMGLGDAGGLRFTCFSST